MIKNIHIKPYLFLAIFLLQLILSVYVVLSHEIIKVERSELSFISVHHDNSFLEETEDLIDILEESEKEKKVVSILKINLVLSNSESIFHYQPFNSNKNTNTFYSPPEVTI